MSPREVKRWSGLSRDELRERWGRRGVYLYGKVDSTNDRAQELASQGAPAGTVVVAREQAAGRGREGRTWFSPAGKGVYVSVVLRPKGIENAHLLPILAGLGIASELERAVEGAQPALKWPNDLMAGERKFGGVLCESTWDGESFRHLVVGAGINVKPLGEDAPEEVRASGTSLEEAAGSAVELPPVADAVIRGIESYLEEPPASLGVGLLDALDRFDWLQDRRVRMEIPGEEEPLVGTCVGIAPDGALLFRPDRGALRRLHSARVVEALA